MIIGPIVQWGRVTSTVRAGRSQTVTREAPVTPPRPLSLFRAAQAPRLSGSLPGRCASRVRASHFNWQSRGYGVPSSVP
eukprot:516282-Hanusia_phi.AAC.1